MEEWKEIYDGLYAVSSYGRVKSQERVIHSKTGNRYYKERILNPEITADGHARVVLTNAGKKKRVFVHRLVAEAFIPNPYGLPIINHIDENPSNNRKDNLEWCTVAYNNGYNDRHVRIGDAEGHTIEKYNSNGNLIITYPSITKAAKDNNVSLTTMWRRVKNGSPIEGYYFKEINCNM